MISVRLLQKSKWLVEQNGEKSMSQGVSWKLFFRHAKCNGNVGSCVVVGCGWRSHPNWQIPLFFRRLHQGTLRDIPRIFDSHETGRKANALWLAKSRTCCCSWNSWLKRHFVQSGALLACGVVNSGVRNECDPALALLSDYVQHPNNIMRIGSITGYSFPLRENRKL